MNWYLAKLVYRIVCGNGEHTPQFDEQLRLIQAGDELHAFQKARLLGEKEQDYFMNDLNKPVKWKFIDVCELQLLDTLSDGAEMYSRITEESNADNFIRVVRKRGNDLLDRCLTQAIYLN